MRMLVNWKIGQYKPSRLKHRKDKRIKKKNTEKCVRGMWNIVERSNMCKNVREEEEEENGVNSLMSKILAKNFPGLSKELKPQI